MKSRPKDGPGSLEQTDTKPDVCGNEELGKSNSFSTMGFSIEGSIAPWISSRSIQRMGRGRGLLPTGRWREPKEAIRRCFIGRVQEVENAPIPQLPIPCFIVQTRIDGIYNDNAPVSLQNLLGRQVTAFAGIAKPERFFSALESLGVRLAERVRFRDHHRYSTRDFERLKGDVLITTEKDAVRLQGLGDFLHLRISVNIPNFDRLLECILERFWIRAPNWVGDAVLAIPAMKAVRARFPESEITLMVRPWVSGLFTSASFWIMYGVNHGRTVFLIGYGSHVPSMPGVLMSPY